MLLVRCATLFAVLLCAASVRSEEAVSAARANRTTQSSGPRSYSPRRTAGYHDTAVEPATFQTVSDAKPLLPQSWTEEVVDKAPSSSPNNSSPNNLSPKKTALAVAPAKKTKPADSGRHLRAPSQKAAAVPAQVKNPLQQLLAWRPPSGSMTAAGSGLAIVVGLMLVSAWVVKKSLPRSARTLPVEVAEVLGRVQLAGKQTAQLLRIGHKLVLVAVTPDGAKAITEITDETEVQKLLAACEQQNGHGSTAAFEQIFQQIAGEPAGRGFLGDEAPAFDPQRLASAYANTPGGRSHG